MNYTIIGATGFIGSNLNSYLKSIGINAFTPSRDYKFNTLDDLGTVFYCAGYGDCTKNHNNILEANVLLLQNIICNAKFDKLLYISSTRLYINSTSSKEDSNVNISHQDNRKLFNLTKLVSEELCRLSNKNIVIIRPSNVYGLALDSKLFLPQIIKNAIINNKIDMYVTPEYSKDYVSVDDLVSVMFKLSQANTKFADIYNIASGVNVSARQIASIIEEKTGCDIIWHNVDCDEYFPKIEINKICNVAHHNYHDVLVDLSDMIEQFKKTIHY